MVAEGDTVMLDPSKVFAMSDMCMYISMYLCIYISVFLSL